MEQMVCLEVCFPFKVVTSETERKAEEISMWVIDRQGGSIPSKEQLDHPSPTLRSDARHSSVVCQEMLLGAAEAL